MEPDDTADKAASLDFREKLAFFKSQNRSNESSKTSKESLRRGPPAPAPPPASRQATASYQVSTTDYSREEAERPPLQQDTNPPIIENKSQTEDRSNRFDDELRTKIEDVAVRKSSGWSPNDMEIFKRPVCLIGAGPSNILTLRTEAVSQLEMIDWPMVVISVVGLYRTGKSYLMNRLAGSTSGFTLGDTIESTTKGIWAWCKIHPEMRNTVLLLLDTEGLGDVDKGDSNHDNKIFTLATLLCNCLVYNMKGAFDQDAVNKLTFVTEMAKNIRYRGESSEDNQMLNLILPDFVLCVRDFSLKLSKGGRKITEDEYLELSLEERKDREERFNKPRECIRKYFPQRKCFTFPVPGDGDVLENLETLRFDQLSSKFQEATNSFILYVYNKKPKKLVASKPVNGLMFATLAQRYVAAIQHGAVPDVDEAFIAAAKVENAKIQKQALEIFESQIQKIVLPVPALQLEKCYTSAQQTALNFLRKNVVHDKDGTVEDQAQSKMDKIWNGIKKENSEKVTEMCQAKLQESYSKSMKANIENKVFEVAGGYIKFQRGMEVLKIEYFSSLCDYEDNEVLPAWLAFVNKTKLTEIGIIQIDADMTQKEKEDEKRRNEENMKKMIEQQEKANKEALEQQQRDMEARQQSLEKERIEHMKKEKEEYEALVKAKLDKDKAEIEMQNYKKELERKSHWLPVRMWNAIWNY